MRFKIARVGAFPIYALLALICVSSQSVTAQTPTPTPSSTPTPTPTATPTATPTPTPTQSPGSTAGRPATPPKPTYPDGMRVTKVVEAEPLPKPTPSPEPSPTPLPQIALYNTITVDVEKLDEFLKQAGTDPAKFVLYLDSRPLRGLNARLVEGKNQLKFDIERTGIENTQKEWNALLGRPFYAGKSFDYKVPVSIGYEGLEPLPSTAEANLVIVNRIGFWIFLFLFALALYLFWWLAKNKGIIRDPCPELAQNKRPYSLGRAQMAFWFFVIATSYFLIWMITSNPESLTPESLALLGISTATALGAAVVGSSKTNAAETKKKDLELERDTLKERLAQLTQETQSSTGDKLTALNKEEAEKKARLAQVEKELVVPAAQTAPQESAGFFNDLLSDNDGISLHRFQMVIWTIVLAVIFVASVYNTLAMPKFSGTLLALMGISGGTYIGFKFPEKQS